MLRLVFEGNIPSKKNGKRLFFNRKTGRSFITSSQIAKDFEEYYVMKLKNKYPTIKRAKVKLDFYAGNKRLFDLTNKTETIMDVLVKAGILADDNYSVVPIVLPIFQGYDAKKKGFVIVEIEEIIQGGYDYHDIENLI